MRCHPIRLLGFTIEVSPRVFVMPTRHLRCFGKSPGKVLIAVLLIPFTFKKK